MRFIKARTLFSEKIGADLSTQNSLDVYQADNILLREFFWLRLRILTYLMASKYIDNERVLDFGGGSGVMLPTLSTNFRSVYLVDENISDAVKVIEAYDLLNVTLLESDILETDYPCGFFGNIVAADVLEHFRDLAVPINKISSWLSKDGILFTSLPTESWLYRILRVLFRKQKPIDHYHSAEEVEDVLMQNGFKKIAGLYHPLLIPAFPLFRISAWQKR
jgi:2-polyprenyl-3-methyl-5-hydroxy-6-metoxy-1,4-benzoquinol methylase